uniref:Replication factor A C-terminal domain-containing protein n=1 Tax=Fagus sylvatica TaxID=28930 RepID=A0A2N9EY65_FAGSY
MEGDKPTTIVCTVLAIDHTSLCYRVCSVCERTLPDNDLTSLCKFCNFNTFNPASSSPSKRLFRVLMSIASDTKVLRVICFDRAAKVLFGCSADDFFDFAKLHPFAAVSANRILEGEMFRMTLSKPKNGNAQHLRVVSVVPLRSGFQPAIESLRELYGKRVGC